jgi:hypothetical protein
VFSNPLYLHSFRERAEVDLFGKSFPLSLVPLSLSLP